MRYNTDGSLDSNFDSDGKVTTEVGSTNDYALSVAIQSDGKIVAAGYSNNGSNDDFALVRYNTDGSLDASFDGDGKVITAIGGGADYALSVAIQSDGKIVAAGYSTTVVTGTLHSCATLEPRRRLPSAPEYCGSLPAVLKLMKKNKNMTQTWQ